MLTDNVRALRQITPITELSRYATRRLTGQSYIEFILVLPLFLIIIAGVVGFGQLLYTKLALEGAAWAGSRHGVATLNQARGTQQAYLGARYTLSGFGLNPGPGTGTGLRLGPVGTRHADPGAGLLPGAIPARPTGPAAVAATCVRGPDDAGL